mgnify:CR=1 FL=1
MRPSQITEHMGVWKTRAPKFWSWIKNEWIFTFKIAPLFSFENIFMLYFSPRAHVVTSRLTTKVAAAATAVIFDSSESSAYRPHTVLCSTLKREDRIAVLCHRCVCVCN